MGRDGKELSKGGKQVKEEEEERRKACERAIKSTPLVNITSSCFRTSAGKLPNSNFFK